MPVSCIFAIVVWTSTTCLLFLNVLEPMRSDLILRELLTHVSFQLASLRVNVVLVLIHGVVVVSKAICLRANVLLDKLSMLFDLLCMVHCISIGYNSKKG